MPTYVYQCPECQVKFECVHRMSEAGPSSCQSCHAQGLVRVITQGNFVLKGEGWYNDGYGLQGSKSSDKKGE